MGRMAEVTATGLFRAHNEQSAIWPDGNYQREGFPTRSLSSLTATGSIGNEYSKGKEEPKPYVAAHTHTLLGVRDQFLGPVLCWVQLMEKPTLGILSP